ncbi:MAG: SGNH/GDSL hydrolase family protein [Gordonia sp. (in: high G+C Gram-positive bacteria)]|uniref:SGNH/GDSL hydrolase family protein n=1 Tax=Gordonia sp. (in: high G+C Gram-positive bacteria) TaxID=84139 RepID=UPI0039E5BB33
MQTRRVIAAAGCAVAMAVAGCSPGDDGPAPSAAPVGARYAHLGDSYAAGSGIDPIIPDSPAMCLRSQLNFGQLLAKARGYTGADFADSSCGAATTANVTATDQYFGVPPQVEVLGPRTELVTLMIGGNDDRLFLDVVSDCGSVAGSDPTGDPCRRGHRGEFDERIDDVVAPAVDDAVATVRERAPNAKLLVVGYPRLLPADHGCYPQVGVASGDVAYVNELLQRVNRALRAAAEAHDAVYVDTWSASVGRDACESPERRWIEPTQGSRIRTTAHPNAAGQRGILAAVEAALR